MLALPPVNHDNFCWDLQDNGSNLVGAAAFVVEQRKTTSEQEDAHEGESLVRLSVILSVQQRSASGIDLR